MRRKSFNFERVQFTFRFVLTGIQIHVGVANKIEKIMKAICRRVWVLGRGGRSFDLLACDLTCLE